MGFHQALGHDRMLNCSRNQSQHQIDENHYHKHGQGEQTDQ